MRPQLLNPLFAPVTALPGVGPRLAGLFDRLLAPPGRSARVVDLLFHAPTGLIDRRLRPKIADAPLGQTVTLEVVVEAHFPAPPGRARAPYRVVVGDGSGDVTVVFFNMPKDRVKALLPQDARRWISGKLEQFDGRLQMAHPDKVVDADGLARLAPVEPVYPLTQGLYPGVLARAVLSALDRCPDPPEWLDPRVAGFADLPRFREALSRLHAPLSPTDLDPLAPARRRLALDDMLAGQLALLLTRRRLKKAAGRASIGDGRLTERLMAALPFALTGAQRQALAEISADLASPERMLRLLQGDVGSGKTVVALLAMAIAVEADRQGAMMVPTEILARQHYDRLRPLAEAAGLRLGLLTGREKGRAREAILAGLAAGQIDIVIGTHALLQDDVAFADLGLAVVDEQHRFGVQQRLTLGRKGAATDLLVMTATPIPRSLVLTYFGDMDVSALREKPAGRRPIDTRAASLDRLDEAVEGVGRALAAGAQVYWVCPLVTESEELDLAAAQERFAHLSGRFPGLVGLIHGRMKGREKDETMARFVSGETRVLVATTVIEVGVDVPNASVMVIEHAERFGLAQLHQLRGRVGRGAAASSCLLLHKATGETARARIDTMRRTQDGFEIAEQDLRLRGEGDVLGTRQSGLPGFRLADPRAHADLLPLAREAARLILAENPTLEGSHGEALRLLLYLFDKDEAVRLMQAG